MEIVFVRRLIDINKQTQKKCEPKKGRPTRKRQMKTEAKVATVWKLPTIICSSTKNEFLEESKTEHTHLDAMPCNVISNTEYRNAIATRQISNCNQTECRSKSTNQEIGLSEEQGHRKSNGVAWALALAVILYRHGKLQTGKCCFRCLFNSSSNKQAHNQKVKYTKNVCLTTKLLDKKNGEEFEKEFLSIVVIVIPFLDNESHYE